MPTCKTQITRALAPGIFALMFSSLVSAQVYKCDGPDGPVFSDVQCGPTASELDMNDSLQTSGLGVPVTAETQNNLTKAKNRRQRGHYINRISDRRDQDIAVIDAQIAVLNRQKGNANNNLAGATYAAGIDQQLAALREARANVVANYRAQVMQVERD